MQIQCNSKNCVKKKVYLINTVAFAKFSAGPIGFLAATPGTTAFDTLATAFHMLQTSLAGYWKSSPVQTGVHAFVDSSQLQPQDSGLGFSCLGISLDVKINYAGLVYRPQ